MDEKVEHIELKPLYDYGKKWKKEWNPNDVSIDENSLQLIKDVLDFLNNQTDRMGNVVNKDSPLHGIKLDVIRFVQIHIPPDQKDKTFKTRVAIGLSPDDLNLSKYKEVFGHSNVLQPTAKRAPGVIHKHLKFLLGISKEDVLGSSFYLDRNGYIASLNRSGQNVFATKVNKLSHLCMTFIDGKIEDNTCPIRISENFNDVEIKKMLNDESVLLQKYKNKYYVYYHDNETLNFVEITDQKILGELSKIKFPKTQPMNLARAFVEQEPNNTKLQEKKYMEIGQHVIDITDKQINDIPVYDSALFVTGGRNLQKNIFEPLHLSTINCIQQGLQNISNHKITDMTNMDDIDSFQTESLWNSIIENDEGLVELLLVKSLLRLSTVDMYTRKERQLKDYTRAFQNGLNYLKDMVNIYNKSYPKKLSKEIKNRCNKLKEKKLTNLPSEDNLSINISKFPIWLSLYITACRSWNEDLLTVLEAMLLTANKNDEQIVEMLAQGLGYAKYKDNTTLFEKLKNITAQYNPSANLLKKYPNITEKPQSRVYSKLKMSTKTKEDLMRLSGQPLNLDEKTDNLDEKILTQKDFNYFYKIGVEDFSEKYIFQNVNFDALNLKDVNFSNVDLTNITFGSVTFENCNFKGVKVTLEQAVTLYKLGNQIKGVEFKAPMNIETSNINQEKISMQIASTCSNYSELSGLLTFLMKKPGMVPKKIIWESVKNQIFSQSQTIKGLTSLLEYFSDLNIRKEISELAIKKTPSLIKDVDDMFTLSEYVDNNSFIEILKLAIKETPSLIKDVDDMITLSKHLDNNSFIEIFQQYDGTNLSQLIPDKLTLVNLLNQLNTTLSNEFFMKFKSKMPSLIESLDEIPDYQKYQPEIFNMVLIEIPSLINDINDIVSLSKHLNNKESFIEILKLAIKETPSIINGIEDIVSLSKNLNEKNFIEILNEFNTDIHSIISDIKGLGNLLDKTNHAGEFLVKQLLSKIRLDELVNSPEDIIELAILSSKFLKTRRNSQKSKYKMIRSTLENVIRESVDSETTFFKLMDGLNKAPDVQKHYCDLLRNKFVKLSNFKLSNLDNLENTHESLNTKPKLGDSKHDFLEKRSGPKRNSFFSLSSPDKRLSLDDSNPGITYRGKINKPTGPRRKEIEDYIEKKLNEHEQLSCIASIKNHAKTYTIENKSGDHLAIYYKDEGMFSTNKLTITFKDGHKNSVIEQKVKTKNDVTKTLNNPKIESKIQRMSEVGESLKNFGKR